MKFSILVPAYKARFLRECIESILTQTYKDFELIIVNDASPEDLTSIVKSFDDPHIRYYINEMNTGSVNVVDNWNKCLSYAIGDYVVCMGDDDKLLPCCLEEYDKLIGKFPGLGVYHAWTEMIDENSNVILIQEARPEREGVYSMLWERWKGRLQFIGDFLFERNLLVNQGGFYKLPLAWASDDISAYRAAKKLGIANMQVPGFQYRINSQTISNTGNSLLKMEALIQEEKWYKDFLQDEPDERDVVEHTFWSMSNHYLSSLVMKKRILVMVGDIQHHGLQKVFKYLRLRKHFRLNMKMLLYAIVETIKRRNTVGLI